MPNPRTGCIARNVKWILDSCLHIFMWTGEGEVNCFRVCEVGLGGGGGGHWGGTVALE